MVGRIVSSSILLEPLESLCQTCSENCISDDLQHQGLEMEWVTAKVTKESWMSTDCCALVGITALPFPRWNTVTLMVIWAHDRVLSSAPTTLPEASGLMCCTAIGAPSQI